MESEELQTRTPVEVHTRYATTVDTLNDAFRFVMEHLEKVDGAPSVTIRPCFCYCSDDEHPEQFFEVVVTNFKELPRD